MLIPDLLPLAYSALHAEAKADKMNVFSCFSVPALKYILKM